MKILVIYRLRDDADLKRTKALMREEETFAFSMTLNGSLREIYETDAFPGGTICIVEAESVDDARRTYADLPMLKAGILQAEYIPLTPFTRWTTLFAENVKAALAGVLP